MLRIRLTRRGKRNQPMYRIVVAEAKRPIKGRFIEILGHYNPRSKEIVLKKKKIKKWISKGAQPSATVHNLLVSNKVISGPKLKATTKRQGKKSAEKQEAKPVEDAKKETTKQKTS